MKVKAIYEYPTTEQLIRLGNAFSKEKGQFDIDIDREYTVLGVFFNYNLLGNDTWIMYKVHEERIGYAPLCLFEVLDNRASQYWKYHFDRNLHIFEPQEFIDNPYFNDDLTEGFPEVVKIFAELCKKMEAEFEEKTPKIEDWEIEIL